MGLWSFSDYSLLQVGLAEPYLEWSHISVLDVICQVQANKQYVLAIKDGRRQGLKCGFSLVTRHDELETGSGPAFAVRPDFRISIGTPRSSQIGEEWRPALGVKTKVG